MSLPYAAPKFADGSFKTAKPAGLPVFDSPVPNTTALYVLRQKFWQFRNDFAPLALNTTHPDYPTYYLVHESELREVQGGGGVVEWERTYAQVPATYSEWENFAYNFIGYFGTWGGVLATSGTTPTGRNRQTLAVQSRVQHDFFLTGAAPYTTPGDIPVIQAQKYRLVVSGTTWWMDIDWLSTNPPFNFSTTPSRATYEGFVRNTIGVTGLPSWNCGIVEYRWKLDGSGNPVVDTSNSTANPGQIAAEDSRLDRWMGNIYLRRTRFVLAQ